MAYSLRWYQSEAVNRLFVYLQEKLGSPVICAATGSGKSLIIAAIIEMALRLFPETRIIVLSHVKEILVQDYEKLISIMPHASAGIYSASLKKRQFIHPIVFGGIHSVYDKANIFGKRNLLIIDECFTGDTLVITPDGQTRIDRLCVGQQVFNACGVGTISNIYIREDVCLIKIGLSNGKYIECTKNHPIFTNNGWKKAGILEIGDAVFSKKRVQAMWKRIQAVTDMQSESVRKEKVLLNILREEIGKSNEQERGQNKNERHPEKNKASANPPGRQWKASPYTAISAIARLGGRVAGGICNKYKRWAFKWCIPELLQSRHSKSINENSNRDKWSNALWGAKNTGYEESEFLGDIRVESIEHIKRKSPFPVYNLHVTGHPSYFANGVLVHNCHMVQGANMGMYGRFISDLKSINQNMRIIGLTATDYRAGRGLLTDGEDKIFDDVVYEITIPTLLDEGYLTPPVGKHLVTQADMTGVKMLGNDFNQKQMAERFSKLEFIEAVIKEDLPYFEGRKTIALFCPTIEIADHVAACMVSHGISCEAMHGDMSDEKLASKDNIREDKLNRFKKGELRALASVGMMTTGTDIPNIDCIVLLFATQSPGLLSQVIGRGFRVVYKDNYPLETKEQRKEAIALGIKPNFLCLDHGGNLERHGGVAHIKKPEAQKKRNRIKAEKSKIKICEICRTVNTLEALSCIVCNVQLKLERNPTSSLSIYASDADIIGTPFSRGETAEWFRVDNVKYWPHKKNNGSESLKVTYYSGIMQFDEYKNIKFISSWWKERSKYPLPYTIKDALEYSSELLIPEKIQVRKKGKFYEVFGYQFNNRS